MDESGMYAIEENTTTNKSFQVKVLQLLLEVSVLILHDN